MHAWRWLYGILVYLGLFVVGIGAVAIACLPTVGLAVTTLGLGITIASAVCAYRRAVRERHDSTRRLLNEIRRRVSLLTAEGYELLIPHEGDNQTVWVRIGIGQDGSVTIEKEAWDGVLRRYSIQGDDARLLRSALGDCLSEEDYEWCHGTLTDARLEYILEVLSGAYSPVRSPALP